MKKKLLLATLVIIFLFSCNMEKRRYGPGYYFHWGWLSKGTATKAKQNKTKQNRAAESKPYKEESKAQETESSDDPLNIAEVSGNIPADVQLDYPKRELSGSYEPVNSNEIRDHILTENTVNSGSRAVEKQKKRQSGNSMMYLTAGFMALAVLGLLRSARPMVMKITRWAKTNPKKTQGLIAGMQLLLMGTGIMAGYNLREMGYELSGSMNYIFGALMLLGFLSAPFRAKPNMVNIPGKVLRQRSAYLAVTLSGLMMMTGLGNSIARKYPNSPLTHVIQNVDRAMNPAIQAEGLDPKPTLEVKSVVQNNRMAMMRISGAGAFLLILLLCILVCAGICITAFGVGFVVSFILDSFVGIEYLLLGIFGIFAGPIIFWLAVKGIERVFEKRRETKESGI